MIIETLLTTTDAAGVLNLAPMGVEWGDEALVIKPFLDTVTFRNLEATRCGVVHLTDDALLFAQAVLHHPAAAAPPTVAAARVAGRVLADACSWREVEVTTLDATPPRARITARVVHRGRGREFLGFNRARHAVLEAAILATRLHLIPAAEVAADFARLRVIVDKTAGPREQEAFALLEAHLAAARTAAP